MRAILVTVAALTLTHTANATNLRITDVQTNIPESGEAQLSFTIAWDNAWRNDRNHDGAWVFLRVQRDVSDGSALVDLTRMGAPEFDDHLSVSITADGAGMFITPARAHRGDIRGDVRLTLDRTVTRTLQARPNFRIDVYAIEMVSIPEGPFTIGDAHPDAQKFGAFYASDDNGEPAGLIRIDSEEEIEVGPHSGALYYKAAQPPYQGDQQGPIPAAFPKGAQSFWVMKYEITQGQYAAFLNSLDDDATSFRAIQGVRGYTANRGSTRLVEGVYIADAPNRPANYISWDDGCAFADWAGLRPMTELEFTKACRGPNEPASREYPWNTDNKDRLRRVVGPDDNLVTTGEADESLLTDDNRDVFGASYYGVMDLAGSVWERCVSIGHPVGRAFTGTHGDGRLTYGFANNEDWPKGDDAGGGYGYRGGGFYEQERTYEPDHFNPYSPIAWRRFGSWGQAPRSVAYGFRAARTAENKSEPRP